MQPPADPAPWLSRLSLERADCILNGHLRGFGTSLLTGSAGRAPALEQDSSLHRAQELFALATVVLAHDGSDPGAEPGPRLIYANAAALQLWRRPWAEMVGLPSRLTAEPEQRLTRAAMLVQAREQHAITGYSGIRIDSHGRRFQIHKARLWTLWDQHNQPCGQAAAFNAWWWL
jgi:hypothetical protein